MAHLCKLVRRGAVRVNDLTSSMDLKRNSRTKISPYTKHLFAESLNKEAMISSASFKRRVGLEIILERRRVVFSSLQEDRALQC